MINLLLSSSLVFWLQYSRSSFRSASVVSLESAEVLLSRMSTNCPITLSDSEDSLMPHSLLSHRGRAARGVDKVCRSSREMASLKRRSTTVDRVEDAAVEGREL